MVSSQKPLTIPSSKKNDHRYGLLWNDTNNESTFERSIALAAWLCEPDAVKASNLGRSTIGWGNWKLLAHSDAR